jgi:hypothetical protein
MFQFQAKLDKNTELAVNQLLQKIIDDFQKYFNLIYKYELILSNLEESDIIDADTKGNLRSSLISHSHKMLLQKVPPRSEILKQGFLTKV